MEADEVCEEEEAFEECPYCKTNDGRCVCGMLQILNGKCLIEGGVAISKQ